MSLRALIVLVAALAAIVGAIYWLGRTPPPAADSPGDAPLLAAFTADALTAIDVACPPGVWTLRRDGAVWRVVRPFAAEADERKLVSLITGLQDARAKKTVAEAGADGAAFGLEPALCRVDLSVGKEVAPRTLRVGRTSPVGTDRYASGAEGRVVLTDGSIFGLLSQDATALRERRLVPLAAESITRIALERPAGRLVLSSVDGVWRVVEPIVDAAGSGACSNLARAITAIELDDARAEAAPVVSRPDRRIAVEVEASGGAGARIAFVATAGIDGKRVGWREGGALIGLLPEGAARELEAPVDQFRDRRVTVLSTPDVRSVSVERAGRTVRVERTGEGAAWTGREDAAPFVPDASRVEAFLARLRTLTAVGFESSPRVAPATGSIVVAGGAGELARLTWGPLPPAPGETGELLWMTTPGRPGVTFRVSVSDLGPIPARAADWTAGP